MDSCKSTYFCLQSGIQCKIGLFYSSRGFFHPDVDFSTEAMGNYCTLGVEYKQTVQMNMMQMFAGTVPHPPQTSLKLNSGVGASYLVNKLEDANSPQKLWLQKLSAPEGAKFTVDMNKITSFISMKCTFEKVSISKMAVYGTFRTSFLL